MMGTKNVVSSTTSYDDNKYEKKTNKYDDEFRHTTWPISEIRISSSLFFISTFQQRVCNINTL